MVNNHRFYSHMTAVSTAGLLSLNCLLFEAICTVSYNHLGFKTLLPHLDLQLRLTIFFHFSCVHQIFSRHICDKYWHVNCC